MLSLKVPYVCVCVCICIHALHACLVKGAITKVTQIWYLWIHLPVLTQNVDDEDSSGRKSS